MSPVDVHQTVCAMDVAGFGGLGRTRSNHVAIRDGMFRAVEQAFVQAGIPWSECYQESAGDSILALAPVEVGKGAFAEKLPHTLVSALRAHNETHPPEEEINLRLALHAGEITYDSRGVTSPAIIHACRLLDAPPLKEALATSPGPLAMIASTWFYDEVIRHHSQHEPELYRQVIIEVKETNGHAWLRVPEHETIPETAPEPTHDTVVRPVQTGPVVLPRVLRPASPEFAAVVDAMEAVPCLRNEHVRNQVVDQLSFGGSVVYLANRRAHVISILRMSLHFEDGLLELLGAISNHEPEGSLPLQRLLGLLSGEG